MWEFSTMLFLAAFIQDVSYFKDAVLVISLLTDFTASGFVLYFSWCGFLLYSWSSSLPP